MSADPMWNDLFIEVAGNVEVKHREDCVLVLLKDQKDAEGRWYYQVHCKRPDAYTGEVGWGYGGKAYLSPHANEAELVRTAFALFKAYDEHEVREGFRWKGRAIFGPHISVEALWEASEHLDFRNQDEEGDREIRAVPRPKEQETGNVEARDG